MRFSAVAVDYDGTLASQGVVAPETVRALERLAASGRKLLLVTGRELDELLGIFPEIGVFDRVVAENGALLFCPRTGAKKPLGEAPPAEFVAELVRRGVDPLSVGCAIVATVTPHETTVIEAIRDLGLELQVIFNKGAVMVLPAGVNKATGLAAALEDLKLSPRNVAAIGDAENDHALLRAAEFGVAVGNALPMLKRDADRSSKLRNGAAVRELLEAIGADDLRSWTASSERRSLVLGQRPDGAPVRIAPAGSSLLVLAPPESAEVLVTAAIERVVEHGYQYCLVDASGRYADIDAGVVLGSGEHRPSLDEVEAALAQPQTSMMIDYSAVPEAERVALFRALAARFAASRAACGRPHWLVLTDLPAFVPQAGSNGLRLTQCAGSVLTVAQEPDAIGMEPLEPASLAVALGAEAAQAIATYRARLGGSGQFALDAPLGANEALVWAPQRGETPYRFVVRAAAGERRQSRKRSAEASLPEARSFYFRGPQGKLNLRAQSLALFVQIAAGVDDETWLFHLRQGDYSRWLREALGEPALADQIAAVEAQDIGAADSRAQVRALLERFVASAQTPSVAAPH